MLSYTCQAENDTFVPKSVNFESNRNQINAASNGSSSSLKMCSDESAHSY